MSRKTVNVGEKPGINSDSNTTIETVSLDREKLLSIVRDNLEKHEADFTEALVDFKAATILIAEKNRKIAIKNLKFAQAGETSKLINSECYLPEPDSFVKEYLRAIRMLELSVEESIDVTQDVFNQLVLDEWSWKRGFMVTSSMYKTALN